MWAGEPLRVRYKAVSGRNAVLPKLEPTTLFVTRHSLLPM